MLADWCQECLNLGSNPDHLAGFGRDARHLDTGPLVAFFDRSERHHNWVAEPVEELDAPLLVCEPVLTETMYLLARYSGAQEVLFDLLRNGALKIAFRIEEHVDELRRLLHKYCRCLWPTHALCGWRRSTNIMLFYARF